MGRVQQLNEVGFVWDELKNRFQINVNACLKFYEQNGRLPNKRSYSDEERKLGEFLGKNSNRLKSFSFFILFQRPNIQIPIIFKSLLNFYKGFLNFNNLFQFK